MSGFDVTPSRHDGEVTHETERKPPPFDYRILLCDDFDAVLEEVGSAVSLDEVCDVAYRRGRVLIQASAGAGKTTTLGRLASVAEDRGFAVAEVAAVRWVAWAETALGRVDAGALEEALEVDGGALGPTSDGDRALLLVDGLNEVDSRYADTLLTIIEQLVTRRPRLGVVVADRVVRRRLPSAWQLASITEVPASTVAEILGSSVEHPGLHARPLYLEIARSGRAPTATLRELLSALGLGRSDIAALSRVVSRHYHLRADRLMEREDLVRSVGSGVVARLANAKLLTDFGRFSSLSHHLFADYLAAIDLAARHEDWGRDEFDALTFRAASFDALGLLLDEVSDDVVGDLVRQVYDWNFYGAAHLLAHDDVTGPRIPTDLRRALLGLFAERRFDRMLATAQQVTDALRLQRSSVARELLGAETLHRVVEVTTSLPSASAWFSTWSDLFRSIPPFSPTSREVAVLAGSDSILGWTAANVLKRVGLQVAISDQLRSLLAHEDPTVRWRAVHALGAARDDEACESLLETAERDADLWVQYGAVRSLIEIAAVVPALRVLIFERLAKFADRIASSPRLASEVERCLQVREQPADWAEAAGLLVEQLWAVSGTVAAQDRWRDVSTKLQAENRAARS